jgi:hypothetical protein
MALRLRRSTGMSVCESAFTKPCPGKMLAAVGHARLQQAVHQALGQQATTRGSAVERAVTNHAAAAPVQVEHRA